MVESKKAILKLIREAEGFFKETGKDFADIDDYVAEYLTANGVIVQPCKTSKMTYFDEFETMNVNPVKVTHNLSSTEEASEVTYFEKIKAMDVDEMAEFLANEKSYDEILKKSCDKCPYQRYDGLCLSKNMDQDCKDAVKFLLEQEVT